MTTMKGNQGLEALAALCSGDNASNNSSSSNKSKSSKILCPAGSVPHALFKMLQMQINAKCLNILCLSLKNLNNFTNR